MKKSLHLFCYLFLLIVVSSSVFAQTTIVSPCTGGNSMQDAIDIVVANNTPNQVILIDPFYYTNEAPGGDWTLATLVGNANLNGLTIDGQGTYVESNAAGLGFFDVSGVDNLTIRNITFDNFNRSAGALELDNVENLVLDNVNFVNGSQTAPISISAENGNTSVTFRNCNISGNPLTSNSPSEGPNTGAMDIAGHMSNTTTVVFEDGSIRCNARQGNGGAVHMAGAGGSTDRNLTTVTFRNSVIANNFGSSVGNGGGALYAGSNMTLNVENCTFYNNRIVSGGTTSGGGGAIGINDEVNLTVTGSYFLFNRVIGGTSADGGAIGTTGSGDNNITITDCVFALNEAADEGGAVFLRSIQTATVTNSLFVNNMSNDGGALHLEDAASGGGYSFDQITVTGTTGGTGIGIEANAAWSLTNSIIVDNGNNLAGTTPSPNTNNTTSGSVAFTNPTPTNTENPAGFNYDVAGTQGAMLGVLEEASSNTDCAAEEVMPPAGAAPCDPILACMASAGYINIPIHEICYDASGNYVANGTVDATLTHTNEPSPIADFTYVYFVVDNNNIIQQIVTASSAADGTVTSLDLSAYMENSFNVYGLIYQTADAPDLPDVNDTFIFTADTNYDSSLEDEAATPATFCGDYISATLRNDICVTEATGDSPTVDGSLDAGLYQHIVEYPYTAPLGAPATDASSVANSDFDNESSAFRYYDAGFALQFISGGRGADIEQFYITYDADNLYLTVVGPNAYDINGADEMDLFVAIDTDNNTGSAVTLANTAAPFNKKIDFGGWAPEYFVSVESSTYAELRAASAAVATFTDGDNATPAAGATFETVINGNVTEIRIPWVGGFGAAPNPNTGATWNFAVYTTYTLDDYDAYDSAPGTGNASLFEQLGDLPFDGDHCGMATDAVSMMNDASCGFTESDDNTGAGDGTSGREPASDNSDSDFDTIEEFYQINNIGQLNAVCVCCQADAGDIATDMTPASFTICEGEDFVDATDASVSFVANYTATDEVDPGTTDYEYAFLIVNNVTSLITTFEVDNTNRDVDFDFSTLPAGTYDIYAISYLNTNDYNGGGADDLNSFLTFINTTMGSADNDIQQINDFANGTNLSEINADGRILCLDLTNIDEGGQPVRIIIDPTPTATVTTTAEVCTAATEAGVDEGQEDLDVLVTAGDMTGTWTIASGNGGGTASITGAMATADVVFDAGMETGPLVVRYTVTTGSCSSTYDVTITRVSCQPPCAIELASINPCGGGSPSDGNNEYVLMNNLSGGDMPITDLVVGVLQDATIDVNNEYDFNYSWNTGGTVPADHNDAGGAGNTEYSIITTADATTAMLTQQLNDYAGQACTTSPTFIDASGLTTIPDGALFSLFLGAYDNTPGFDDPYNSFFDDFSIGGNGSTDYCGQTIYVLYGTGSQSGFASNSSSRAYYVSLNNEASETVVAYNPSGSQPFGMIDCNGTVGSFGMCRTPSIEAIKQDQLTDGTPITLPLERGATIQYEVVITNSGDGIAGMVNFTDDIAGQANITLVQASVTAANITYSFASPPTPMIDNTNLGNGIVDIDLGDIPVGEMVTIVFQVTIDDPTTPPAAMSVQNQGTVSGDNVSDEPTDDPDTAADDDPTITPICIADAGDIATDMTPTSFTICQGDDLVDAADASVSFQIDYTATDEIDPGITNYEYAFLVVSNSTNQIASFEVDNVNRDVDIDFSTLAAGTYDIYAISYLNTNDYNGGSADNLNAFLTFIDGTADNDIQEINDFNNGTNNGGTNGSSLNLCLDITNLDAAASPVQVVINPLPDAAASSNTPICSAETVNIDVSNPNEVGGTFNWTATYNGATGGAGSAMGVAYGTAAISETLTNSTAAPITVTYTITPIGPAPTNCTGTAIMHNVVVNPLPDAAASSNTPICSAQTANIDVSNPNAVGGTFNWTATYNGAAGGTGSATGVAYGTSAISEMLINSTTSPITVTYTITPIGPAPTSCAGTAIMHNVVVNPLPDATVSGGGTVCQGDALPDVTITLTGTAPWSITYNDGSSLTTINNIMTSPYTISNASAGTYTVEDVTDGNNCSNEGTGSATVTVNPLPDAAATSNAPICSDERVNIDVSNPNGVGGTFNWTATYNGATGGSGGATGVAYGTATISEVLMNNTNAAVTVTYTITPIGPNPTNCEGTTITHEVIVGAIPNIMDSSNSPVCSGETANITITNPNGVGGNFNWSATYNGVTGGAGFGFGVAYGTNAISETLTNPTNAPITVTYRITPMGPDPTNCENEARAVDVTVNPTPDASAVSTSPICSGTSTMIDVTNPNGVGGTFNWTATYGAVTGGAGSATGVTYGIDAIDETLINTTNAPINVTYTITPIGPATTNCEGMAITHIVVVAPLPNAEANSNTPICSAETANIDVTNPNMVGGTFNWTATYNGATGGAGSATGVAYGTAAISETLTNTSNAPITVTYTITPIGPNPSDCAGTAIMHNVVVNPIPDAMANSSSPICSGGMTMIDVTNPNGVGGTFNWTATYNGATGGTGSATTVAYGADAINETLTNMTTAPITVTYTITPIGPATTNCEGTAITHNITVSPALVLTSGVADCGVSSTQYSVTFTLSGGTGTYPTVAIASGMGMLDMSSGDDNTTFTVSNIPSGTTVTINATDSDGCMIMGAALNTTMCNCLADNGDLDDTGFTTSTCTVPATVDVGTPPLWTGEMMGGFTQEYILVNDADDLIDEINATGQFTGLAVGSYTIYAINYEAANPPNGLSVDNMISDISGGCFDIDAALESVNFIVYPIPDVAASSNTPICSAETANIDVTNPNMVGGTFNWTATYNGATGGASSAMGVTYGTAAISETLTNTSNAPITVTYTITPIGPNPDNCVGTAIMHDVVVNPIPDAAASSNTPICSAETANIDVTNPNGVGGTFSWTATYNGATGGAGSAMSVAYGTAAISETLTNSTNAAVTVTYTITPIGPAPTNCEGTTMMHDVVVNPLPNIAASSNTPICSVETAEIDVTNPNMVGGTFNWTATYNGATGGAGSANGVTYGTAAISETLTNSTNAPITVTYTMTPIGPDPTNCEGTVIMHNVVVNPLPDATASSNTPVCSEMAALVDVTNPNSVGGTFNWTAAYNGVTGGAGLGTNTAYGTGAINETLTNSTNAPITVTYTITPIGPNPTNCIGADITHDVVINPLPNAVATSNSPICSDETANIDVTNPNMVGGTFNWTATYNGATGGAGSATSVTYGTAAISETLTNSTNAPITITYTITPIGPAPTNCVGTAIMHNVIVNPLPNAMATSAGLFCSGETTNVNVSNPNSIGGTFNWTANYNGATGGANSETSVAYGTNAISEVLSNTTNANITVTYTITPIGPDPTNCEGAATTHDVIITPDLTLTSGVADCGTSSTQYSVTFTLSGGSGTYTSVAIASGMGMLDMTSGDNTTTFTVSNIPSGTFVTIDVVDSDNCMLSDAILNQVVCNCMADNGTLDGTGFTTETCTAPANINVGTPPLWTGEATAGFTQQYILVNDADGLIDAISGSGEFTGLAVGTYTIYAINFETANPPTGLTVGNVISEIMGGCFVIDAATESVDFTVHPLPIANNISLQACADQGTNTFTFNLSDAEDPLASTNLGDGDATLGENMEDDIDNGADGAVIVTYHANQTDADNNMNVLTTEEVTAGTPETLIARVEDATTGCFSTATLSLNVLPLPTASITSNATVCSGDDAVFGITGTNGATLTYNFNGGTNTTLTLDGTAQTLTFPMATSDVVLNLASVSTSGMNACTNELGTTATVMVRPNPVASIVGNDAICSGNDAIFEVLGTDGSTLTYSFDGGTNTMYLVLNGTNQNITFPMAMSDVTLTLISVETGGTPNCSTILGTSAVVEVRITPTATVEAMASVCTEETEVFNDNGELDLSTLITNGDMSGTWMITSGNTNGTATLMGSMFDAGMETGPFNLVYTIAGVAPCSDNTYDVTITREECIIPEIFNENGPTFADPCFCLDNATTLTDGQFGEEIVIISDPGETWTVVAVDGLFNFNSSEPPAAPIDDLLGATFTENPLVPGEYLLLGKHIDAIGYTISATSPDHQGLTLTISNTCFYPEPAVLNVPTGVNVCSTPFTVEGVELNGLLPENAGLTITGPNGFSETVDAAPYEFTFDPAFLELGTYVIEFFFDAGTPTAASQAGLPAAQADPGCTITTVGTFEMLVDFDGVMVCNDQINVTLNGTTCEALIEPASLIEGEYDPDLFTIVMQAADGTPVSNPIDGTFAGQCVTAMITENCSGNSCWGTICVEDKSAPVCAPAEESEVNISYDIDCNGVIDGDEMSVNDPSGVDDLMDEYILCSLAEANGVEIYFDILEPFDIDGNGDGDFNDAGIDALADFTDCTAIDYIFFQDEVTEVCEFEDLIGLPIDDTRYNVNEFEICEVYQRTWFAIDVNGDQSTGCSQYVFTLRPKANRIILEPVVSVDCTEDFPDTAPYFTVGGDANLDNNGTGSEGPMYADDKIYELPSNGHACKYAVSFHEDPEIEICEGSFKKLRHWTVVDWCDGSRVYDEFTQLIKVEDNTAPFIGIDENGDGIVDLDAIGQPIAPPTSFTINAGYFDCEAAGNIPFYATLDNCSASTDDIINVTIERITNSPFDEEVYIAEFENGADVADLDLIFGVYTVTYIAVDDCGNESIFVVTMTVEDRNPPVAICNDILNVTLTSFENGDDNILLARVTGEDLDDTSYDNCFEVSYLVRSTANASPLDDDWQEWVELSCDDLTNDDLIAELLVFEDRNGDGQFVDELTPNPSFTVGGGVPQFFITPDGIDDFDGGLSSVCTTVLQVEDLAIPTVVCEDKAIDCDNPDLEAFRNIARVDFCAPSVTGGCDNPLSVDLSVQIIDITYDATCKTGVFVRRWTATRMINGEALTATCDQYITVSYQSDWTMTFPVDQVFECAADGTETPTPLNINDILENDGCDQWGMEVEDEVYDIIGQDGDGACYKIVRTYKFINWCTWDPTNTELAIVNRPEGLLSGPAVQLRHRSSNFGRNQFGDEQDGDPYNEIISALDVIAASSPDFDANLDAADDGALVLIDNDFAGGDESQDTDINVFNRQYSERINSNDNVVGVYANNYGYFAYRQIIKVADTQAPVIDPIADMVICDTVATAPDCAAALTICGPSVTDCRSTYQTTYTVSNAAGEVIALGEFVDGATPDDCIELGAFPFGVYTVTYTVEDGCGNFADVTYTITTSDCKAPTAYCIFGLSVDLMPSGMVELWAEDFDAGSFDECSSPVSLSFNGEGTETSRVFDCDDLGTRGVQLWVTDASGNSAYCTTFVFVQANPNDDGSTQNNCGGVIEGRIFTELDEDIADVQVHLSGNMTETATTGVAGLYNFTSIIPEHDYTIVPEKDIHYLNGVSTFDLVLIKKHILGIQLLDSPYKLIAADANNSQSITTFDMVQLRKLILVIDETLAANTSWRFVDANYEFPDPSNPWLEAFPELINVNDYGGTNMSLDFVGVKIGDVNHSAIPNNLVVPEDRNHEGTFYLKTKDEQLSAGESVQLDFYPSMTNIEGYQFTLNYATDKVELMEVQEGIATASNFGIFEIGGVITSSWEGEFNNTSTKMFSLVFKAKEDLRISDVLELTSQYTTAEAYVQVDKQSVSTVWNVGLDFENNSLTTGFELYQNHPNPYQTTTAIGFHLPQAAFATLTLHDVTGRVVEVIQGDYAKGLNRITLAADKFQTSVLYYTLETEGFTATKKMILIK